MPYYTARIHERRSIGHLTMLRLYSPELAQATRPGHLLMVRCAPEASFDPLLRRAVAVANSDPVNASITLLVAPTERGLHWLAAQSLDATLDLYGPVGTSFALDRRTQRLLLAGSGAALPSLLFLAAQAVARRCEVVLLAAADRADLLPPAFLLPSDVEYQTSDQGMAGLISMLASPQRTLLPALNGSVIAWADQVAFAGEAALIAPAADAIRAGRMRWERGFAHIALDGALPCGLGICQSCSIITRDGVRLRCKDGPVFDLRDLRL